MKKQQKSFQLATQLFFLHFSPIMVVTFINFGFYVMLFEQIKTTISNQEQQIYVEQQTSKKQLLLGMKTHLDLSFSLQSQEYYTLSRFITKIFQSEISLDSGFVPPLLNLERLYLKQEDQTLTDLYEKDSILTTVWQTSELFANNMNEKQEQYLNNLTRVVGEAKHYSDLTAESYAQLQKAAVLDILVRSFNLLNVQRTFQYQNQYIGFQLDGSLVANPSFAQSMNESFQKETICPVKLYYDATCRIWYNLASQQERTIMPSPFKVLTTKVPYMSLSLCRKSNAFGQIHSVACLSFNIEQLAEVFQELEIQTGSFSVIHPSKDSLIYQKNIDYSVNKYWTEIITINMTITEKEKFVNQLNSYLIMSNTQNQDGIDLAQYEKHFVLDHAEGFEFEEQGLLQYCLLIPIQIADKANGSSNTQFSDIMILLYVFSRDELVRNFKSVTTICTNIFLANSVFHLLLLVFLLMVILYYSKEAAEIFEMPISDLIEKLNSISAHLLLLNETGSENELVLDSNIKSIRKRKRGHTCSELTDLEKYISNIQQVFNFNISYCSTVDETAALFTWVKAAKHFQLLDDSKSLGSVFNNIANMHFNNNRFMDALDCFSQSLVYLQLEECVLKQKQAENLKERESQSANIFNQKCLPIIKQVVSIADKYFHLDYSPPSEGKIIQSREHETQKYRERMVQLKSLRFDRLFAYSQVLLSCSIGGQIESSLCASRILAEPLELRHCYLLILSQNQTNKSLKLTETKKSSKFIESQQQSEKALLKVYFSVLSKLLKLAKDLDNDEQRYILIYLETSKALMLQGKIKKSRAHFRLAYRNFLKLFKRFSMSFRSSSQQNIHVVSYLLSIQNTLSKRFSSDEISDEVEIRPRNITAPSKLYSNFQKQSLNAIVTGLHPFNSARAGFQPIIEDHMEQQDDKVLNNPSRNQKITRQEWQQNVKLYTNTTTTNEASPQAISIPYKIRANSLAAQTSTQNENLSYPINVKRSNIEMNHPVSTPQSRRQSQFQILTPQLNSQILDYSYISDKFLQTQQSASSESNTFVRPLLTFEGLSATINSVHNIPLNNQNNIFDQSTSPQKEILRTLEKLKISSPSSNISWASMTSFNFPIDILFTKLQIHEAVIEIKSGNILKGCEILTEAFENAPRFLPSDRLLSLQILEQTLGNYISDTSLISKQITKINQMKLNVSVIMNCEKNQLKRVSKQLYELRVLCDTFGLVVVNEQVEQYIMKINQQCLRGKKNFISNIFKYLSFKTISTEPYVFYSAVVKATHQFIDRGRLPENTQMKKFLLILGNYDCLFEDSLFLLDIIDALGKDGVKMLIFSPSENMESEVIHIDGDDQSFKIRFFSKFEDLTEYLSKKSLKCSTKQPFLIEKI